MRGNECQKFREGVKRLMLAAIPPTLFSDFRRLVSKFAVTSHKTILNRFVRQSPSRVDEE